MASALTPVDGKRSRNKSQSASPRKKSSFRSRSTGTTATMAGPRATGGAENPDRPPNDGGRAAPPRAVAIGANLQTSMRQQATERSHRQQFSSHSAEEELADTAAA